MHTFVIASSHDVVTSGPPRFPYTMVILLAAHTGRDENESKSRNVATSDYRSDMHLTHHVSLINRRFCLQATRADTKMETFRDFFTLFAKVTA